MASGLSSGLPGTTAGLPESAGLRFVADRESVLTIDRQGGDFHYPRTKASQAVTGLGDPRPSRMIERADGFSGHGG
jgi:hypothetical protein